MPAVGWQCLLLLLLQLLQLLLLLLCGLPHCLLVAARHPALPPGGRQLHRPACWTPAWLAAV